MKILLTGATGYIGKRLLPVLVDLGYEVICCVRDIKRFNAAESLKSKVSVIEIDLLDQDSLIKIPNDIDAAYYLVHSMSSSKNYQELESLSAINFRQAVERTNVKQVIYLSGIVNERKLSPHLISRKNVEIELNKGTYNLTSLRSGIIIGSGSASFEIIRDIVEKLPIMIAPKWLNTKCQPIGVEDVISFLYLSLFNERTYNQNFDIGGPDVLSYRQMLMGYAKCRNLKRKIIIVPVMTPRLSSYWLYFVTSTSYQLAVSLVNSMKVEVICRDNKINSIIEINPIGYELSLKKAFTKIKGNEIISSWKDSYSSSGLTFDVSDFIEVPFFGCFVDRRSSVIQDKDACLSRIWSIGGETGYYYANFLWRIRGFLDKIVGGVGLRRGRTNINTINTGDSVDFWRVLYADKSEGRLLLFAEMKLPGEAWLEFKINGNQLEQTATFRPLGIFGRIYWYAVLPLHSIIFKGMLRNITSK